jgi:hypothetical protein
MGRGHARDRPGRGPEEVGLIRGDAARLARVDGRFSQPPTAAHHAGQDKVWFGGDGEDHPGYLWSSHQPPGHAHAGTARGQGEWGGGFLRAFFLPPLLLR